MDLATGCALELPLRDSLRPSLRWPLVLTAFAPCPLCPLLAAGRLAGCLLERASGRVAGFVPGRAGAFAAFVLPCAAGRAFQAGRAVLDAASFLAEPFLWLPPPFVPFFTAPFDLAPFDVER